jgi:N6-L-threonylcarbamoyladenine synthase
MIILSIETSCDETAVSILKAEGDFPHATYTILGNSLYSQVEMHRQYGGVFPAVAKREHAKTLVPMLEHALEEASLSVPRITSIPLETQTTLAEILNREAGLADALILFLESHEIQTIDCIAVTNGPGLEPALWVGISFAKALATYLNIPVVPVNHMEGHVLSSLFTDTSLPEVAFPALALLISGGHTELVKMDNWQTYTNIGETRDDAVGEAFDKVARMLGLEYPGGPEVSKRAKQARETNLPVFEKLPRPMLDSGNLDFSFSGLKTAVRYAIDGKTLTEDDVLAISRDFEDAVTEVLLKKTQKAIDTHGIQTLIVGGGVSANTHIRETFASFFGTHYPHLAIYFPPQKLSTDNSIMIALAGHARLSDAKNTSMHDQIVANGNLAL